MTIRTGAETAVSRCRKSTQRVRESEHCITKIQQERALVEVPPMCHNPLGYFPRADERR